MKDLERDFSYWSSVVNDVKKAGLYSCSAISQRSAGKKIYIDGRELLLFSNNDYLGLMDHPAVIEKGIQALKDFGSSTCSSQITLSTILHQQLERELGIKSGETTEDLRYTLETVNCVGACALGPIVIIDGKYSGEMKIDKVQPLLESYD